MNGAAYLVTGWALTPLVLAAYVLRTRRRLRALEAVLGIPEDI